MTPVMPERLRIINAYAGAIHADRTRLEGMIRDAVKSGHSLRAVGRAAGVSARTVQRIAEREQ